LTQDCYFCGESKFSLNKAVGLPGEDSIIYRDENLFITPDIAPLVKGHFLIVPNEHLLSFAEANDSVKKSLKKAKEFLSQTVFENNKKVLFFEHGAVKGLSNCDCVDHAHIHALPISFDIDSFVKNSDYVKTQKQIATNEALSALAESTQPYLYYEMGLEKWVYPVDNIPSQFFREIVASYLKIGYNYNWKIFFKEKLSNQLFKDTLDMGLQASLAYNS
jgi:diadenosine tetraphosphate (Ap4A) HIT family hydrolase